MKVYIAGPYSQGDVVVNIRNAIFAGDKVLDMGHMPFIPHLSHLWHTVSPKTYEEWMAIDIMWLGECHALLRLPGESKGADREVQVAIACGIPVFYSLEELKQYASV